MAMLPVLLLAATGAFAGAFPDRPACQPVPGVGCYLERPGSSALIIYHRGWLTRKLPGDRFKYGSVPVPEHRWPESAADAVAQYQLDTAAAALNASLLVTGTSAVSVDLNELPSWIARPQRLIVVAHSGGYVGLDATLDALPRIAAVVLLDCFYGVDSGLLPSYAAKIRKRLERDGTKCGGFYTTHNAARFADPFQTTLGLSAPRCPADSFDDDQHEVDLAGKIVKASRGSLKLQGPLHPTWLK